MSQPCCSGRGQQARPSGRGGPSSASSRLWAAPYSLSRLAARRLHGDWRMLRAAVEEKEISGTATALSDYGLLQSAVGPHVVPDTSGAELTPRRVMNRKLKGAQTLLALRDLVLGEATSFDGANLAHAFGRLAKVAKAGASQPGAAQQQQLHSEYVAQAAQQLSKQLPRLLNDLEAWDVAQSLWAMSELRWFERSVFDALCHRGCQVAALMKPADCAMVMLAFGRFGHFHTDLLKYIPQVMLRELDQVKACETSSVLWGFAKLGLPQAPGKMFMEAVTDNLAWTIDQYGCQELVNCLWATAVLGHHPGKGLLRAAEQKLVERVHLMNCQDISNALWAFGRMRYKACDLLDELPPLISLRLDDFKPAELSCVLHGYVHARHYHAGLMDAAAPVIMRRAAQMSDQDLVIALWAFGIFGHRPTLPGAVQPEPTTATATAPMGHGPTGSSGAAGDPGPSTQHSAEALGPGSGAASDAGLLAFVEVLLAQLQRRLRHLRPVGLGNVVKALASLQVALPQVQALAREAAALAEARIQEFRPDEMCNLLYGLSLLQYDDLQVYYACVRELLRTMEDPEHPYADARWMNHKVFNSIIHSCVSSGYTPWTLMELAEVRGIRVHGNPTSLSPRWQAGHPAYSATRAAWRAAKEKRAARRLAAELQQQQELQEQLEQQQQQQEQRRSEQQQQAQQRRRRRRGPTDGTATAEGAAPDGQAPGGLSGDNGHRHVSGRNGLGLREAPSSAQPDDGRANGQVHGRRNGDGRSPGRLAQHSGAQRHALFADGGGAEPAQARRRGVWQEGRGSLLDLALVEGAVAAVLPAGDPGRSV